MPATEHDARGHGNSLAFVGHASHLDQQGLTFAQAGAVAQIAALTLGQAQEDAPLPLHQALDHAPADIAGHQGGQPAGIHQQVGQHAVLHQGGGFGAEQMAQNDLSSLHGQDPFMVMPLAASIAAVSDNGKPTTAENDP